MKQVNNKIMNDLIITRARLIKWDKAGIVVGIACLIHCLFLPVALTVFPIFGIYTGFIEKAEIVIIVSALFLGALSIYRGFFWHHHNKMVLFLLVGGLATLLLGLFVPKAYQVVAHTIAAFMLTTGHIYNGILCQRCQDCNDSKCG